jgi:hypothetical protein
MIAFWEPVARNAWRERRAAATEEAEAKAVHDLGVAKDRRRSREAIARARSRPNRRSRRWRAGN